MSENLTTPLPIVHAFAGLSEFLHSGAGEIQDVVTQTCRHNAWFTPEGVNFALSSIAVSLEKANLVRWLSMYGNGEFTECREIRTALVMAGNIPAVGFHDILCVLASGATAMIKLSSQDTILIPFLLEKLVAIEPAFQGRYEILERLAGFNAVIATGSNNSSRYFEYYFGKHPHIIRKNRNSVAVLSGYETDEELILLGEDIFRYFGLGCRNVSKLYVPEGYVFNRFFELLEPWSRLMDMHKYAHNYDYQLTLKLINRTPHLTNGFLIVSENESLHSSISVLHYETYADLTDLKIHLHGIEDQIQCLVSSVNELENRIPFGSTQQPQLWDYADRIDTMKFLAGL